MSGGTTPAASDPVPREEIVSALDDVLSRSEFDTEPTLLEEFLDWLFERISPGSGAGESFDAAAKIFLWLAAAMGVLVVLLGLRLWWISRVLRRSGGALDPLDPGARVRARVAELRGLAREAREAGDLALALRYLVFCLVVGLGQRGNLNYRDAWTNRELLERGRPSKDVRTLLGPLVAELEAKEFGREPTTAADVDRLEDLCDRWLAALRPPAGAGETRARRGRRRRGGRA